MKVLKLLLAALILIGASACGSDKYDAATCDKIAQKIDKKEALTDSDYDTMMTQMVGAVKYVKEQTDAAKGDREKENALRHDEQFTNAVGYVIMFDFYLEKNKNSMSEDSKEKLEQTRREIKELGL